MNSRILIDACLGLVIQTLLSFFPVMPTGIVFDKSFGSFNGLWNENHEENVSHFKPGVCGVKSDFASEPV